MRYAGVCFILILISFTDLFAQPFFENAWFGYVSGVKDNGRFPQTADKGDINGDGIIDLVIGQYALDPGFKVLFGNPDGSFSNFIHYAAPKGTEDIKLADINNDSYPDVIYTNSAIFYGFGDNPSTFDHGYHVLIYINNGDGTFAAPVLYQTGRHPRSIALLDINNDSFIDFAVANQGNASVAWNTVTLFFNDGTGVFTQDSIYVDNLPRELATADLDKNGFMDLVISHNSLNRTIIFNNNGVFDSPIPFGGIRPPESNLGGMVDALDLNNDTYPDILFLDTFNSSSDKVTIYYNDGTGGFLNYVQLDYPLYGGSGERAAYADLNDDGYPDIVSGSWNGNSGHGFFVFLSNGSGGFHPVEMYNSGQGTQDIFTWDINEDGKEDVITVDNSMSVNKHLNLGSGLFPRIEKNIIDAYTEELDAGDIDLDGDLDIVTSADDGYHTSISVLLSNGDGTFAPFYTIDRNTPDKGGAHVKLRRLDNDNYPDLLFLSPITNLNGYLCFISYNNGDGTFSDPVSLPFSSCGWGDVDAADLDNDGDLDIVLTEYLACMGISESGRRLFIVENLGAGNFALPEVHIIGNNPEGIWIADFNADGNKDIATANYGVYGYNNFIQIHLGDGNLSILNTITYTTPYGPHDIIAADFNNDGILDIATANTGRDAIGEETMSVLIGNGIGTFQQPDVYPAAYSSDLLGNSGLTSGDIDFDGDLDIMVANQFANDLGIYINDGTGSFEYKYRMGSSGEDLTSPFFADFTGDGIPDLAVVTDKEIGIGDNYVTILKGIGTTTNIDEGKSSADNTPTEFILNQNYPNPFNPSTKIRYTIPAVIANEVKQSLVSLKVYDVLGKEVAVLVDEYRQAGTYEVIFDGSGLASGIYFYRLTSRSFTETKKMILAK